jgi:hypothetical protein
MGPQNDTTNEFKKKSKNWKLSRHEAPKKGFTFGGHLWNAQEIPREVQERLKKGTRDVQERAKRARRAPRELQEPGWSRTQSRTIPKRA